MPSLKVLSLLPLATLAAPLVAQNVISARPGSVNYVEGQVSLNGEALHPQAVGSAELGAGQTIETGKGKAEILLTPGVFLRLGSDSSVRMVTPDLTHTEVALERGKAEVEVDQLYKQNDLLIDQGGSQTRLVKGGLYEFDANDGLLRVFDGRAEVSPQAAAAGQKQVEVKSGHLLALSGDTTKTQSFSTKKYTDELTDWSDLRSDYLGQANEQLASQYAGVGGVNSGWLWSPSLYSYTWLPGNGLFWSPFGYGFYSPAYLYGGGYLFGGGYGYGLPGAYGGYAYNGLNGHGSALAAGLYHRRDPAAPALRGAGGGDSGRSSGNFGGFHATGGGAAAGGGGFHGGGGSAGGGSHR